MNPREHIARHLERLDNSELSSFIRFVREGDPDGPTPCWGAIFERFADHVQGRPKTRMEVWRALLEADDRRAQWLFLHLHRDDPDVLGQLLRGAEKIPETVQCALVALEAARPLVDAHLERLCSRAKQLWRSGEEALRRERQLLDGRIGALMMLRFFVPSSAETGKTREDDGNA